MITMIIDATDHVLGRVASFVAKKTLLGETVEIVNCDQAVITGTKVNIMHRYKAKTSRGDPFHGPYIGRQSHMMFRRTIRGMLPRRQEKGLSAYRRIKCHIGVPEHLKDRKFEQVKGADISKMSNLKYMKLGEVCKLLGGRI